MLLIRSQTVLDSEAQCVTEPWSQTKLLVNIKSAFICLHFLITSYQLFSLYRAHGINNPLHSFHIKGILNFFSHKFGRYLIVNQFSDWSQSCQNEFMILTSTWNKAIQPRWVQYKLFNFIILLDGIIPLKFYQNITYLHVFPFHWLCKSAIGWMLSVDLV